MLPVFYKTAKAHIHGGSAFPNIDGIVSFKDTKDGVLMTAKIHNLPTSSDHCVRKIFWFSHSRTVHHVLEIKTMNLLMLRRT